MRVEDLPNIGVLVLPLAFSLAIILNSIILWIAFEKEFNGFSRGVTRSLFDSLGTSVVVGIVAYLSLKIFAPLFGTTTLIGLFLQGAFSGLAACIVGIAVLVALKNKELKEIWIAVRQKFGKIDVIATDHEIV